MKFGDFVKVKSLQTAEGFRDNLRRLGLDMPCDDALEAAPLSPMAQPLHIDGLTIGNRYTVHPMEGWDAESDGRPSDNTRRRWQRFGASGAKLIWGGEAVAVRPDGRANPNQLMLNDATEGEIGAMRELLVAEHRAVMGNDDGLVTGLQLTHSGRFCKPNDHHKQEPMILYRHPILDRRFKLAVDYPLMTDGDIRALIDCYVQNAKRAAKLGFQFVDIKACHGYLGHEFLSAKTRAGEFGGSLENRTRFLREIVAGIKAEAPGMKFGMRISAADLVPFRHDPALTTAEAMGPGAPEDFVNLLPYRYSFGTKESDPLAFDLSETKAVIAIARELGIHLFNITLGSPYYNPHLTRPALYPPSDGYHPPEDPLIGVMRHLNVVRELKQAFPGAVFVGSGYTYLQEFLPYVAQAAVRAGWTDSVGLGRMMLSYPDLPADVLAGRPLQRKRLCRTFSDCTTAPRHGVISGCYPLDAHYKKSPEMVKVAAIKKAANIS